MFETSSFCLTLNLHNCYLSFIDLMNGFSRRHFLYLFSEIITIIQSQLYVLFSWLNPWPWEIVKFEKELRSNLLLCTNPKHCNVIFLDCMEASFFSQVVLAPIFIWCKHSMVLASCVPPRSGKLLKSAIWVGIAKDHTLAVLFCCEKSG